MIYKIPGGREKGTPLTEASDEGLAYWSKRIGGDLENGTARYPDKDRPLHAAMVEEIARRSGDGGGDPYPPAGATANAPPQQQGAPPQQQSTALAARDPREITGSLRDPSVINERMQLAATHWHLITPTTVCTERLPEGYSLALSAVTIDPKHETYGVGSGKFALSKSALEKISGAAGISWDPHASGRTDDGSDPHYCAWQAVGTWKDLDGTIITRVKNKEMDLRDESALVEKLKHEADKDNRSAVPRIREMRAHILAHAESKAQLRVIRSLGLRSSYDRDELKKAFVVAKLMWTGDSGDPELKRAFAMKQADAALGGSKALYGEAPTIPALPAPAPPPPVGASREYHDDRGVIDTNGEPMDEGQY